MAAINPLDRHTVNPLLAALRSAVQSRPPTRSSPSVLSPRSAQPIVEQGPSALRSTLSQIGEQGRQVQAQVVQIQSSERTLRETEVQLRQLRTLARQASAPELGEGERQALSARFATLQRQIDQATRTATVQGQPLAQALTRTEEAESRLEMRVELSGQIIARGRTVEERGIPLAESAVARARGLAGAQVERGEERVVFRFQDLGNGQIRAVRLRQTDQGLEETGAQTAILPGPQLRRLPAGQTAVLEFERLGLQITLNERYAPGDLQGLELAAIPATEPGETSAPLTGQTPLLDLSLENAASAEAAMASLDQMLARIAELRQGLQQERENQQLGLRQIFASLQPELADREMAALLATSLRDLVLRQAAAALSRQGNLTPGRLIQLLA